MKDEQHQNFRVGCITIMILSVIMLYGAFYISNYWDAWWTMPTFIIMIASVAALWVICPICWIIEQVRYEHKKNLGE